MPTFTTKIYLESTNQKDHQVLVEELTKRSFTKTDYFAIPKETSYHSTSAVTFSKHSNSLQEINEDVIRAARETGKTFSFTVTKNKN